MGSNRMSPGRNKPQTTPMANNFIFSDVLGTHTRDRPSFNIASERISEKELLDIHNKEDLYIIAEPGIMRFCCDCLVRVRTLLCYTFRHPYFLEPASNCKSTDPRNSVHACSEKVRQMRPKLLAVGSKTVTQSTLESFAFRPDKRCLCKARSLISEWTILG